MDRSAIAQELGIDTKSVTNLYKRATPDGIRDLTLSRLASLLGIGEPVLLTKWKEGLPDADVPQSVRLMRWFDEQSPEKQKEVLDILSAHKGDLTKLAAATKRKPKSKRR